MELEEIQKRLTEEQEKEFQQQEKESQQLLDELFDISKEASKCLNITMIRANDFVIQYLRERFKKRLKKYRNKNKIKRRKKYMKLLLKEISMKLNKKIRNRTSKMKKYKIIFLLTGIIILNSCATILQGSKQGVSITSEPSTAKIYVNDEMLGIGYTHTKLKRSKSHIITVKQDGYNTRYMDIDIHLQPGWIIADVIFGWFPLIIDAATGAWNAFDKDHYIIQLEKKSQ